MKTLLFTEYNMKKFGLPESLQGYLFEAIRLISSVEKASLWLNEMYIDGMEGYFNISLTIQDKEIAIPVYKIRASEFFSSQEKGIYILSCQFRGISEYLLRTILKRSEDQFVVLSIQDEESITIDKDRLQYLLASSHTIDLSDKSSYPGNILNPDSALMFSVEGFMCASIRSFLEGLSIKNPLRQRLVFAMTSEEATKFCRKKRLSKSRVWFQGKAMKRGLQCDELRELIQKAFDAAYEQNGVYKTAVQDMKLKNDTINITEQQKYGVLSSDEVVSILEWLAMEKH